MLPEPFARFRFFVRPLLQALFRSKKRKHYGDAEESNFFLPDI